jgi:hypothetical protein
MNDTMNMRFYSAGRSVPQNAVKKISGGAYGKAGLSDINPQWRIERMTEMFGPCGIGWTWEPISEHVENGVLYIHVIVKYRENDEWSAPVHGYGGTKLGILDDSDAYKSTVTDAISNALRFIGVGADVWYKPGNEAGKNQFDTKYSLGANNAPVRMAEPGQLEYILANLDADILARKEKKYGSGLVGMTYEAAEEAIKYINSKE